MSKKFTEIKLSSREGDNIFDKYYSFIETLKVHILTESNIDYSLVEKALNIIERNLQDINQEKAIDKSFLEYININLNIVLEEWFPIFQKLCYGRDFISFFSYNLFGFSFLINKGKVKNLNEIEKYFTFFSPSIDYDILKHSSSEEHKVTIGRVNILENDEKLNFSIKSSIHYQQDKQELSKENINFKIRHKYENNVFIITTKEFEYYDIEKLRSISSKINILREIDLYKLKYDEKLLSVWTIIIKTDDNNPQASKLSYSIFSISKGIELVDEENIEVLLYDWGSGSKWAKLKVKFKSFLAKEETKDILEKARKAIEAEYLDKKVIENEKTKNEAEKIKKEADNIMDKQLAEENNRLDVELKKLEIIEKEVDIQNKILDAKLKSLEALDKVSSFIKDGIIQNDSNLEMYINGLLFFQKSDVYKLGSSLDTIEEKESIQPKEEDDSKSKK